MTLFPEPGTLANARLITAVTITTTLLGLIGAAAAIAGATTREPALLALGAIEALTAAALIVKARRVAETDRALAEIRERPGQ